MQLALINLNHPAHYNSFGPFAISVGNLVVILAMMVLFLLALFIPFPHSRGAKQAKK
jgi:hypothetical protein